MNRPEYLFVSSDLRSVLEGHEQQLLGRIDGMDPEAFLNKSPDALVDELLANAIVEVPRLLVDDISINQDEARVDVSGDRGRYITDRSQPFYLTGTRVTFFIPFKGDAAVFQCVASTRSTMQPVGVVQGSEIAVSITRLDHNADAVRSEFETNLGRIQQHLGWAYADITQFNAALPDRVRGRIESRRQKLLDDRGLAASLGYKMRERPDARRTYAVAPTRRKPPVVRSPRGTPAFKPEPAMPDEDYERILEILSNMVGVMETSPSSFKTMKEEDLRQHFLFQLNGQYLGDATGETFNFSGKTDILVKDEGKTIFIAECKFWKGPKSLTDAIDQLLGYTSWRDTKTAILLFNRTKNLSDVLAKIPAAVRAHPNFKRETAAAGETAFRFICGHRDDPDRELTVTILVFEVPA